MDSKKGGVVGGASEQSYQQVMRRSGLQVHGRVFDCVFEVLLLPPLLLPRGAYLVALHLPCLPSPNLPMTSHFFSPLPGGAWLELVHVALGLAGGSVSSAFWQNFGRSFVLFAVVDTFSAPKVVAWLPALLLAWSGGELIR